MHYVKKILWEYHESLWFTSNIVRGVLIGREGREWRGEKRGGRREGEERGRVEGAEERGKGRERLDEVSYVSNVMRL